MRNGNVLAMCWQTLPTRTLLDSVAVINQEVVQLSLVVRGCTTFTLTPFHSPPRVVRTLNTMSAPATTSSLSYTVDIPQTLKDEIALCGSSVPVVRILEAATVSRFSNTDVLICADKTIDGNAAQRKNKKSSC